MISGQKLFEDYCSEKNLNISGSSIRYSKFKPPVSKTRFISLGNRLQKDINPTDYKSKHEAKKAMVSKIGFIEFLIFKALIYWIVDRILSYYFGASGSSDHPQVDARVL